MSTNTPKPRIPEQTNNLPPVDLGPGENPVERRFCHFTKFNYWVYFILFSSKVPAMWHIFNLMLLNAPMDFTCPADKTSLRNATEGPSSLRNATEGPSIIVPLTDDTKNVCPCSNPVWDKSEFTETIATKFGIYCEKKHLGALSETMTYFGMLVGALFYGMLSDKFGRLIIFCITYFNLGLAGLLVGIAPNMTCFFIFRFLEGLGSGGSIVSSFVLCVEYAGTKFRETITALYHIPINIGHVSVAAVAWFFRNSFTFQIVISIPMFIWAAAWFCMPESPLWLISTNRRAQAVKAFEMVSKCNKRSDPTIAAEIDQYCSQPAQTQPRAKLHHIFKYKRLTINFLCMAYLCFICGMGYYGVSQYISKMSNKIHLNIVLSGLMVTPGTLASYFLLNKFGRKPLMMTTNLVSGILILVAAVIPKDFSGGWPRVLIACISNCFFFMSFITVFLYNVEMFPTQIRNSVLGALSLLSRAGMMIAPQINSLSQTAAGIFYGVMAIIGGILTIFLPETKNRQLPATMQEAEASYTK